MTSQKGRGWHEFGDISTAIIIMFSIKALIHIAGLNLSTNQWEVFHIPPAMGFQFNAEELEVYEPKMVLRSI